MNLQEQFRAGWQRLAAGTEKGAFLVAVSGGRDSMALATLMYHAGIPMALAHCNFQLRGEASDLDEQLVVSWGHQRNITVHSIRFDTREAMAALKTGIQETARKLRYDWFDVLCREHAYAGIVTAHHAQDNAETLLINLCKGTGIAGLHGIPERNKNLLRPLLFAGREAIDAFVTEEQIPYRDDASNDGVQYLRNAVRHKVLPVLNEVFPGVTETLNENIHRFKGVEAIYRAAIVQKKKKLLEQRGSDYYIPILKLLKEPAPETLCFELLSDFGFSAAQIPEVMKLLNSETGRYVANKTHRVIRNRNFLIITGQAALQTDLILVEAVPCTITTADGTFSFRVTSSAEPIRDDPAKVRISMDNISFPLILRRRKTGDYFYPLGMAMKKKKVNHFLSDLKLPLNEKERIWVVEHQRQVVWIAGYRLDERFRISPSSKNILEIAFSR